MDKYFTKKESSTIVELLRSRDFANNCMGMNLILTHPRYKCMCNKIIFRIPKKFIPNYMETFIKSKRNLQFVIRVYGQRLKINQKNNFIAPKLNNDFLLFNMVAEFVEKRTFKNK